MRLLLHQFSSGHQATVHLQMERLGDYLSDFLYHSNKFPDCFFWINGIRIYLTLQLQNDYTLWIFFLYCSLYKNLSIPWLSSVKYLVTVLSFMFRASAFAIRMTSIIEIGRFLPDVRTELNSPSVVRPITYKQKCIIPLQYNTILLDKKIYSWLVKLQLTSYVQNNNSYQLQSFRSFPLHLVSCLQAQSILRR